MSNPILLAALRSDFPDAVEEHRFHPVRKWRFDLAIPSALVAVEIDGGVWSGGRHSGGAGQIKDMEKLNAAAILGWRVLRFTPQQLAQVKPAVWAAANRKSEQPTDTIRRASALEKRK